MPTDDKPPAASGSLPAKFRFLIIEDEVDQRLDRFLPEKLKHSGMTVSRSVVQHWIRSGLVSVTGKVVTKPRHSLNENDEVYLSIPEEKPLTLEPENIPLTILFEDEDIIVVNKQSGLVVHPGAGNEGGTLVNALLHHCDGNLSSAGEIDRPGIVHRLDKDTSGCLVAAKSDEAYHSLVAQFFGRTTKKEYLAIIDGIPVSAEGRIDNHIGRHPVHRQRMTVLEPPAGRQAITDYQVEITNQAGGWARVRCRILTGRTHQIRVHMKESLRCAILGDPIYGKPSRQPCRVDRLMLHAETLQISHPVTGRDVTFRSEIPAAFEVFY